LWIQILKKVHRVAYALDLPRDWMIHNVSHISLLNIYVSNINHEQPDLPQVVYEGEMLVEPENILQIYVQHLMNRSFKWFLKVGKNILRMMHHCS
jgi:hypothetical protein